MDWVTVWPLIVPLTAAIATFLTCQRTRLQNYLAVFGGSLHCVSSILLLRTVHRHGIQTLNIGGWPAPFGISFVADHFSALMVVIAAVIGFCTAVYAIADVDKSCVCLGHQPLLQILLTGICGAFLTGDIFNLYVWFEVMLMASFALLLHGGTPPQIDGAVKYVALNLFSTLLFVSAVGLLYSATGDLNMAALHQDIQQTADAGFINTLAVMFMVAFGVKAALFPLFFWLPAAYHTPPVFVSAVFAGLLTKVGVYALIRIFTLLFIRDVAYTHHTLLLWAAGLTMIAGVLGAAARNELKRILSFHIVSQIGYMVMGLALFTPLALAGAVFYLMHHIIVKANLFLLSGIAARVGGSYELRNLGSLYGSSGFLALLFFIPAFSLAGFPPLSGFWAKFFLIKAGIDSGRFGITAVAVIVGLLTAYSMTKIWAEAFWKPAPAAGGAAAEMPPISAVMLAPAALLSGLTLAIGLYPAPFFSLARQAAFELMHPAGYARAVLGVAP